MTHPLADNLRTARVMLANYAAHDVPEDAEYTRGIIADIDRALHRSDDLAAAIERLDWSRTSLQHQLVMSAAILALRGDVVPELENPVGEMQSLLRDLLQRECVEYILNESAFSR